MNVLQRSFNRPQTERRCDEEARECGDMYFYSTGFYFGYLRTFMDCLHELNIMITKKLDKTFGLKSVLE